MTFSISAEHGAQAAELATSKVIRIVRERASMEAKSIRAVALAREHIEYAGYATDVDLLRFESMGAVHKLPDVWEFQSDEAMEDALGLFTAICSRCLFSLVEKTAS